MASKRTVETSKEGVKIEQTHHSLGKSLSLELNTPGPTTLWCKTYPLQIVVVNLDPKSTLLLEQHWFNCGDFWEQPFWNIGPYQFQTFSVCESKSYIYGSSPSCCASIFCCIGCTRPFCCGCCADDAREGVSGGVGFLVETAGKTSSPQQMFVCTFANTVFGPIKGSCEVRKFDPSSKGNVVKAGWQQMKTGSWIRSSRCGFYRGNMPSSTGTAAEYGDKKMVFVWKPESVKFDEVLAARATQKHDLAIQNAGNEDES